MRDFKDAMNRVEREIRDAANTESKPAEKKEEAKKLDQ